MKRGEIFTTIIAEASGDTPEAATFAAELAMKMTGTRARFDEEVSDEEAERLLVELRKELPGIRAWLEAGRRRVVARVQAQARKN